MRREMFQEICLKHGLKIEVEPRPQRQRHKSVHEYKREQSEKAATLKKSWVCKNSCQKVLEFFQYLFLFERSAVPFEFIFFL